MQSQFYSAQRIRTYRNLQMYECVWVLWKICSVNQQITQTLTTNMACEEKMKL